MLFTRNLIIVTLLLSMVSPQAISVSSKFSYSESQLYFAGVTHLTPLYSDDPDKDYNHYGISTATPHHTPIEFVSASLQAGDYITSIIGLYGEIGTNYALNSSQLFASGSLEITPNNFSPYAGLGVYYTTQNSTTLELGASISYFGYSLASKSTGTLFNSYTEFVAKGLHALPTDIKFNLSYPLTDKFQTYLGLSYGFHILSATLPSSDALLIDYQCALLEEQNNTTAAFIGDYYGRNIDMQFNKASIGLKLNITDI